MRRSRDTRPMLVTGGAGFIGCNIADRFAGEGHEVIVFDALSRPGVERNLQWLRDRHGSRIVGVIGDVRDENAVARVASDVKGVFHMAAQVAVTTSLSDPREDFDINVRGTLNVLDAIRLRRDPVPVIFASTNKVYGDLGDLAIVTKSDRYEPEGLFAGRGISETRPLDFHTPYGCSKGAADQYILDYARSFGIPSVVFRMSCIYGRRQMGTEDQGWVAHFLIRALAGEPITIYGDGKQVRDILDVSDAVDAYVSAFDRAGDVAGNAFNLGGGPGNAISLLELLDEIRAVTDRRVELDFRDWRQGDQRWYVSDTAKAREALGLRAPLTWRKGVARLASWLASERGQLLPNEASFASAAE
ncbi:MAG TPA: SDR family NAD(P)-dependent oxidoreductase [Sphingomicrobium sp.]|nr:SDR family NAD(P)-dependent oxidoreductase [Sphingomicrobium sp.]